MKQTLLFRYNLPKFALFAFRLPKSVFFTGLGRSLLPKSVFLSLLGFSITCPAATYYVTANGGGNHSGTSIVNSWSVGDFNGTRTPGGGDTVTFTGSFTSTVAPACSGSGNGSGRLTLDLSGATLNSASTRLQFKGNAYLTVLGGTFGSAFDGTLINFNPNNGGISHDVTIDGFSFAGQANGTALFLALNHVYNFTLSNCTVSNVATFVYGDSTLNHDLDITGCNAGTSTDTTGQDDLIHLGDAANVTIENSKLLDQSPANPAVRHNDVIQTYTKGGSNPGNPTNWVIRYNWIEMGQTSGSGDCSWLMMQSMAGSPALKVYSNVFIGTGSVGNNGILVSRDAGGSYYFYNNTVVRHGNPINDIRFLDSGTLYSENNVGFSDSPVGNFVSWKMGNGGWDYNVFFGAPVDGVYAGPHGSVNVNPGFNNVGGNDFSLSSGSPLKGKGNRNIGSEYGTGIAPGAAWPNPNLISRSSWDIGAY